MIKKQNRSKHYVATIDHWFSDEDRQYLKTIRDAVKVMNKLSHKKYTVKLAGRGHRHHVDRWQAYIPLDEAEYADIYIYERSM